MEKPRPTLKPDALWALIQGMRAHMVRLGVQDLSDEQAEQIDAEIRAELGGQRVRIPKRGKHPSKELRSRVAREALDTNASDEELTRRFGISRSSLYRYVKRG